MDHCNVFPQKGSCFNLAHIIMDTGHAAALAGSKCNSDNVIEVANIEGGRVTSNAINPGCVSFEIINDN